tara:strand:- start:35545 stop:37197 length:1653 start_codon:yes stop_codon:yes gene_type:complete
MIVSTSTPKLLANKQLGQSVDDLKAGNLCETAKTFEQEIKLNIAWSAATESTNPLNGYREYTKQLIQIGPDLDPQTLVDAVERLQTLPPAIYTKLTYEVDRSLSKAHNRIDRRSDNTPAGSTSDYMFDDNDFINNLANLLLNCTPSCNYLHPISDNIGASMIPQQMTSPNASPLWDKFCALVQTPINGAIVTFNRLSQNTQRNVIGLNNAVEGLFRDSLTPFFSDDRVTEEENTVTKGVPIDATAHGYDLVTDTYSYLQTGENHTEYLMQSQRQFSDCFRMFEYHRRYNPNDIDHNKQAATKNTLPVDVEGETVTVDYQGKKVVPMTKGQADTISAKLRAEEEEYPYDDLPDGAGFIDGSLFPTFVEMPEGAFSTPPDDVTSNSSGVGDDAGEKYNDLVDDPSIPTRPATGNNVGASEVAVTSYTWDPKVDRTPDSNSTNFKGNRENLLGVNSLALSKPMVNNLRAKGTFKPGDAVYVTNDNQEKKFLGYWDDTSPAPYANIDFFHVNSDKYVRDKQALDIKRISSGAGRGTVRWSQQKADALKARSRGL